MQPARRNRGGIGDNWAVGAGAIVIILAVLAYMFWPEKGTPFPLTYYMCDGCGEVKMFDDQDRHREFMKKVNPPQEQEPMGMLDTITVYKCPDCGEKKLYKAEHCPDCDKTYIPLANKRFPGQGGDVCPQCKKYSPAAERAKKYLEEHGKK